jgi:hypothetical protein
MWGIGRKTKHILRQLRPKAIRLSVTKRPSQKFAEFASSGEITIPRRPVFSRDDVFFTMGSCFAEEIRRALTRRQITCVPRYGEISFDPSLAAVDGLPDGEHMNFYNTFTVRLQIEQLLGLWTQAQDDYWKTRWPGRPWGDVSYQDPYRRLVLAKTPEILANTIDSMNKIMLRGFEEASAFIFTFGMTEVFVNAKSGKVASQKPLYSGGGGLDETTLQVSSFGDNLENVLSIIDLIRTRKPNSPIVMTVSPVALSRTFQKLDIVTVNTESKSILRAVLGQAARERENVIYLPSYEFVTSLGYERAYRRDRRHVRREIVDTIIEHFFAAHMR